MNTTTLRRYLEIRFGKVFGLLHDGLALVGLAALLVLPLQGARYASEELSVAKATAVQGGRHTSRYDGILLFDAAEPENPKYRVIANYLSRKYKVAPDATEQLVSGAFDAGQQVGVDPLLILAVMAVESRFNPIAESVRGAKGLMQVIPRFHQDKLGEHGGADSVLHPMTNILVGASILKEYTRRAGSVEAGLRLYSGGLSDTSGKYSRKVMAEMDRLRQTIHRHERAQRKDSTA
jgi:soluble lytic murein transglycosylase-like protein